MPANVSLERRNSIWKPNYHIIKITAGKPVFYIDSICVITSAMLIHIKGTKAVGYYSEAL
jgi:hypothetical protein